MVYIRNHEISTPLLDPARPVIPSVLLGYLLCSCSFCYTSCICTFRTMGDMRPRDKVARYCSGIFWLSGVRDPDQIRMGPMFNSSAVEWSLLIFSGRILCIASNQHYLLHHFVKITVCKFSCVSICGLLCGFQGLQVKARNFVVFAWTSLKSAFRYGVIITEIWTGLQARQNHTTHTLFSFFVHRLSYSTLANDAVWLWKTKEDSDHSVTGIQVQMEESSENSEPPWILDQERKRADHWWNPPGAIQGTKTFR